MPFNPAYNNLTVLGPYQTYFSRPDLQPPLLNVNGTGTPGYVFFTQRGTNVHQSSLTIADSNGTIIYVNNTWNSAFNFNKQHIQGQDVLTFWNGTLLAGYGQGNYYFMNNNYETVASLSAIGAGLHGDLHEFKVVNNTALITVYETVNHDLTPWGGSKNGVLLSGRFQQIDLCTSTLLFDWRSIDHISPNESFALLDGGSAGNGTSVYPWDYFHMNAVDVHPTDGTFLVSARHTSTLYKIANNTAGDILWRLTGGNGGKAAGYGNFTLGANVSFEWQHDARWRSPTEISLFDNGAQSLQVTNETVTRGLRLGLNLTDPNNLSVSLTQQLIDYASQLTGSQGNVEYMENGNFWVGYGDLPYGAEYDANGTQIVQFQIAPYFNDAESYRMFKFNFTAYPTTIPDVALADRELFVSWNGATEVTHWNIYTGSASDSLSLLRTVNKTSFETGFRFPQAIDPSINFTQVGAVDSQGRILGLTQIVRGAGETVAFDKSNIVVTQGVIPAAESFTCLPISNATAAPASGGGAIRAGQQMQTMGLLWMIVLLVRWLRF